MSRHTPGKWEVIDRSKQGCVRSAISDAISPEDFPFEINMPSPPFALGATGALIARKSGIGTHEGSAEANANLIAAAPQLLEALKSLLEAVCGEQRDPEEIRKSLGVHAPYAVELAEQAISLAERGAE